MNDTPPEGLMAQWKAAQEPANAEVPKFDAAKYLPEIEDIRMSEAQKVELLQTLWDLTAAFARWGFGVDSVRLVATVLEEQAQNDPAHATEHREVKTEIEKEP